MMNSKTRMTCVLGCALLFAVQAQANAAVDRSDVWNEDNVRLETIPVSPVTYYVSLTGDDSNPGTEAQPFRTIQKAADGMVGGDTCIIREGIYRETVIPVADGTEASPIIFQAVSNETVEICGCDPVSSWTLHTGSVYRVTVSLALGDENQVFRRAGGSLTNLWLARWPNSTDRWNPVWATADSGSTKTELVDAALPDCDWSGAEVRINQSPAWGLYGQPVTNCSSGIIQMTYKSIWDNHDLQSGSKYFVHDCYDALDADGEWFFDESENTLYVVSSDGNPGSGSIEYKARKNAFDLSSRSHIMLKGLKLTGCTIRTDSGSSGCTLDRLAIEYPYYNSRMVSQTAQNTGVDLNGSHHVLKNSEIAWGSGAGVKLNGEYMDVINCTIHDCNYVGSFAAALLSIGYGGRGHVISHNTLSRTGRSCMDMRSSSRVLIQYNDMGYCGKLTSDLGSIYGPKVGADNSEIRYNWFHDNESAHSGSGIYFDHATKNLLIHHNVVWDPIVRGGIQINQYGLCVLMCNNTLANSGGDAYESNYGSEWPDDMYGSQFVNNVGRGAVDSDGTEIEIADNLLDYTGIVSNKYLPAGSPAVDTGRVILGITDEYVGAGPDKGAYEQGGLDWKAGHNFSAEPTVDRLLSDCPYLNRISNSDFERGTLEPWVATGSQVSVNYEVIGQGTPLTDTTGMGGVYSAVLGSGTNRISQVLTNLLPNSIYEFRSRIRGEVGERACAGVEDPAVQSTTIFGSATNWSDTRLRFVTGLSDTAATIYVQKSSTGSGNVYLDDFSVLYQGPAALISSVGCDESTLGSWRSTSVSKPLDIDGDNVYGTAGYIVWATENTGDAHSSDYNADRKIEALPEGITVSGPGVNEKSYSAGYLKFDDPTLAPGAVVGDIFSGLAYRVDCGEDTWQSVAVITVDTVPVGTLRVGIIHNGGGDTVNAIAMKRVGEDESWTAVTDLDTRNPYQMRYCFFDLTGVNAGDQFEISFRGYDAVGDSEINLGLAGLSFDVFSGRNLIVDTGTGGIIEGAFTGVYTVGSTVTVSAVPSTYYSWGYWVGDVPEILTNANPLTFTMDVDRSIAAVFTENLATNSVPEWWLAQYGWTNHFDQAALGDSDLDGLLAWEEFLAGTNPKNGASVLAISDLVEMGTNQLILRWQAVSNKSYSMLSTTNLLSNVWKTNAVAIPGHVPESACTANVDNAQQFFRIDLE
jgi:hypothetical protein